MGNHQHTIELNGKHYDALTGSALAHTDKSEKTTVNHTPKHQASIDGVVRHHGKKSPARAVHAKPAKSQTLMRNAVAKPHITATSYAISKTVEDFSARKALEDLRLRRAKKVPTSKLVSRFGIPSIASTKVVPKHTDLSVKQAPTSHQTAAHPSHPPIDHFQAQLDDATAHTAQPLRKPKLRHRTAKKLHVSSRKLSIGSAVAVVILLSGFMAYQNASLIAIHVAANRAGIAANVPGYTPSGFALKSHAAQPGQITIGYRSNSDSRAYQITQSASAWDSNTLLENFVGNNQYHTISSKGRTVYLYNDNNATWVDNGIWFKVEGNGSLSSNQLQHLIDSI